MRYQKRQTKTVAGDYEILSLTRAKLYLYITGTAQDDVITDLINGAVAYLEQSLDFIVDTDSDCYQFYDAFPAESYLPIWHRFITDDGCHVHYWNGSAWTEFSTAYYRVDNASVPCKIILKDGYSWPTLTVSDLNAVRVTFVPDTSVSFYNDLKAAIMTLVAARYENREAAEVPQIVKAFIDRHRIPG